jgi:hypothetical protein
MFGDTASGRKARIIALSAAALAVVGGLSLFNSANGATETPAAVTEPATVIPTSCSGFEADVRKLFDERGNATLNGTFAPGDHVHLAVDLSGAGYSWGLSGVSSDGPHVTPSLLSLILLRTTKWRYHSTHTHTPASASTPESSSTVYNGNINGYARWDVEFDVTAAGDGALTINEISARTPPKIAIASCTPGKGALPATG